MMSLDEGVPLSIADIVVRLINSKKHIKSVDVLIGSKDINAQWQSLEVNGTNIWKMTFSPAQELLLSQAFSLRIHFRKSPFSIRSTKDQEIQMKHPGFQAASREWRKVEGKTEVIIGLGSGSASGQSPHDENPQTADPRATSSARLQPTTEEILRICPRFRILVIGKTGVGKSSLINKAFGVTEASVSHSAAGEANIDTEILSKDNDQFVLHDSKGFEPGEVGTLETVQSFIQKREKMTEIKDKLHAVWLCLEIPRAGGRLLETGVEDFLKSKGELGKVPVIGVFTKYDKLVTRMKRTMSPSDEGPPQKEFFQLAEDNAKAELEKVCIDPFKEWVGKEMVPHVHISTEKGHELTLTKLIQLTYDEVYKYLKDASIVTAIAQKVNPSVNIEASIAVGRKRYWRNLASSLNFPGRRLRDCLEVIHTDVVNVWNFKDDHHYLSSASFQAMMSNLVAYEPNTDPHRVLGIGLPMVSALAGIVSALAVPAAPIVIPIAACFVLAKWVYDIYEKSQTVLKRLMTYIIDLTLVMQNVFWFQEVAHHPISRRLIKLAFTTYNNSDAKQFLHDEIEQHVKDRNVFSGQDATFDKIVELIERYRVDSAEMFKHQDLIQGLNLDGDDEEWNTSTSGNPGR